METPFIFGKMVEGMEFTNRTKETQELSNNFISGTNTTIISPRRWGKSSLVAKAALYTSKKEKNIRFCLIDLFNVRSENEFYQLYAQEILKATASKWDEIRDNTKKFLGKFIPKISFSPDEGSELSLGLDWQEVKKQPDEILDLAEKIAQAKKIKIVVCIDEFQNIADFGESLAFQKKLRAHWQRHKNVSYCLYGSKRNMMIHVFSSSSMPFYKFGHLMFLEKITHADWIKFIVERFADTGKKINASDAGLIADLCECHPHYVQQLAQQVWLRSPKKCNTIIINEAYESLILQLSLLFQTITDELSSTHVNFLHALLDGTEQFSSKETLRRYQLGTSANVLRIKHALINKEIIDTLANNIQFNDPIYKAWLKKVYFRNVRVG